MQREEKISNNNYFIWLNIATLLGFIFYNLIKAIKNFNINESGLTWVAGTEIIPIIENIRGNLKHDFMSQGALNSPVIHTANLISKILPLAKDNFIPTFATIGPIFSGIIYCMTIACISLFVIVMNNNLKLEFKKNIFIILLTLFTFYISNPPLKYILTGHIVGYWYLPISDAFQQTGISMFFCLISIIIPLIAESKLFNIDFNTSSKSFQITLLSHLFCIYLHPVVSLFQVLITFCFGFILKPKKDKNVNFTKLSLIFLSLWILGIIINLVFYNQPNIDPNEFFKIYVEGRAPHHYLPSFYLDDTSLKILGINLFLIFFIIIKNFRNGGIFNLIIRTSLLSIFLLITIHSMQFIFVEIFKINPFIKLGISRMSGTFNFFYISIIVYETLTISNKYINKFFKLKIKFNLKYFIILLISINVILSLNLYSLSSSSIPNNKSLLISKYIDNKNISKNAEYIFDSSTNDEFIRAREIGNMNIFSDDYIPFNTEIIIEWGYRKEMKNKFLSCLSDKNKFCNLEGEYNNDIFLISKINYNLKQFDSFSLKDTSYFIYILNKSTYD